MNLFEKYRFLEEDFRYVYRCFQQKNLENEELVKQNEKLVQENKNLLRNQKLLLENITPIQDKGEM